MSKITYRNLGPNNDPLWGQGQQNFISDISAVAQAIRTRLLLFEAEWWASLADGTPYWQQILGKPAGSNVRVIELIIAQRIIGTPFVNNVSSIEANFDNRTFSFTFTAIVQTQFGVVSVTNYPTPPGQALPQ